jgi:hypothetical protein
VWKLFNINIERIKTECRRGGLDFGCVNREEDEFVRGRQISAI